MRLLRKALRWTVTSLGFLLLLSLAAYSFVFWRTQRRLHATYPVETLPIQVPRNSAALARGEHIFRSRGCADCHGHDLGGKMFLDNAALGRIAAPNLSRGSGGLPADFGPADWLRVLRHGVNREGEPLAPGFPPVPDITATGGPASGRKPSSSVPCAPASGPTATGCATKTCPGR